MQRRFPEEKFNTNVSEERKFVDQATQTYVTNFFLGYDLMPSLTTKLPGGIEHSFLNIEAFSPSYTFSSSIPIKETECELNSLSNLKTKRSGSLTSPTSDYNEDQIKGSY